VSDLLGMQRAVWRSGRTTTEKIVLLAIIDYYSESSQQPWPSVPTLSERTSLGRTAVLEAIAALERDGVLAVRREHGRPNRYDLSRVCIALAPVREADQSAARTTPSDVAENADGKPLKPSEPVREANPSATQTGPPSEQDPSVRRTSPVRVADPKEPKKEPKMEASRARAGASTRIDEVLVLPVAERARLALASPRDAQRLQPQDWPEVRRIVGAFAGAVGRERRLGEFGRDSGLRAIVALLAAGNSVEDIEWVAGNVPKQAWWRSDGKTRGLATFSPEVVARALEERDSSRRLGAGGCAKNSDERRIHRNTLLAGAEAGRYGVEVQRRARSGGSLRELADDLERWDARGELRSLCAAARDANDAKAVRVTLPPLAKAPVKHLDANEIAELVSQIKSIPRTAR
jgi:hypothetical protein